MLLGNSRHRKQISYLCKENNKKKRDQLTDCSRYNIFKIYI